jgi:hypothetical protein
MRMIFATLFTLLAVSAANAQYNPPYAWCAEYSGSRGGGTNCGFVTLQQCQWAISGNGGFCRENHFYAPSHSAPRKKTQRG